MKFEQMNEAQMKKEKPYHLILKISENPTTKEIKKAFKDIAITHHPDKNSGANQAFHEQTFKEATNAKDELFLIIEDPVLRAKYKDWVKIYQKANKEQYPQSQPGPGAQRKKNSTEKKHSQKEQSKAYENSDEQAKRAAEEEQKRIFQVNLKVFTDNINSYHKNKLEEIEKKTTLLTLAKKNFSNNLEKKWKDIFEEIYLNNELMLITKNNENDPKLKFFVNLIKTIKEYDVKLNEVKRYLQKDGKSVFDFYEKDLQFKNFNPKTLFEFHKEKFHNMESFLPLLEKVIILKIEETINASVEKSKKTSLFNTQFREGKVEHLLKILKENLANPYQAKNFTK